MWWFTVVAWVVAVVVSVRCLLAQVRALLAGLRDVLCVWQEVRVLLAQWRQASAAQYRQVAGGVLVRCSAQSRPDVAQDAEGNGPELPEDSEESR